jgi:hypothetical protein
MDKRVFFSCDSSNRRICRPRLSIFIGVILSLSTNSLTISVKRHWRCEGEIVREFVLSDNITPMNIDNLGRQIRLLEESQLKKTLLSMFNKAKV